MQIRSLDDVGWHELATAFNAAFSDYGVPMAMTAESLANMQRRRGYVASASFGAYEGARMVGFVLTCIDGDRAYNSGTGVLPSHRGTGVARALLDAAIACTPPTYVLEVLEDNARAIALYARAGFVETRRFSCWTYGRRGEPLPSIAAPDLAAIAAHADVELAWQNSVASLGRASEPCVVLGDAGGAAVVFPASADLALLAVAPAARRRGRGTRLLGAAAALASRPLRILNIDTRAAELAAFLAAAGAVPFARQIEMVRTAPAR